jgi:hypothetical protein
MVSIKDNFPDRLGFLFCFLRGHFDMFGHRLVPSQKTIVMMLNVSEIGTGLSTLADGNAKGA